MGTSGLGKLAQTQKQAAVGAAIPRPGTAIPAPRAGNTRVDILSPLPRRIINHDVSQHCDTLSFQQTQFIPHTRNSFSGNTGDLPADQDYQKRNINTHIPSSELSHAHRNGTHKAFEREAGSVKPNPQYYGSSTGPQRIPKGHGEMQEQDEERSPLVTNKVAANPRKRSRTDRDDDDSIHDSFQRNPTKRFKAATTNEKSLERMASPSGNERRSSSISRPTHSNSRDDGYGLGPQDETQEDDMSRHYEDRLSQQPPTGVLTLETFFDLDSDKIMAMFENIREHEVLKWQNCTEEQWRAYGDEISKDYQNIMDEMRETQVQLSKAYQAIRATGDRCTRENERRKETLVAIRRRITEASSNVFS
ncbi:hypothetical protein BJ165DRAFT_1065506 [Panaeolus papilionaceus]|nr:hypothetical protein BJ165DRAFT_1065506 [Panaeolus papilionaceus]